MRLSIIVDSVQLLRETLNAKQQEGIFEGKNLNIKIYEFQAKKKVFFIHIYI